jgi:hypothetical protein
MHNSIRSFRDDVDCIMETFSIVKRKDEQKYGEYGTKRIILECYDAVAEAMKTSRPYQTILGRGDVGSESNLWIGVVVKP